MTDLWPELAKLGSYLITSGAVLGAVRSLITAVKKKRAGVAVRDGKRRLDLTNQLAAAVAALWATRECALAHGIPLDQLPDLPPFLKDPT